MTISEFDLFFSVTPYRIIMILSPVFCQVRLCCLKRFAKEVRKAGGFMPVQPVETEKTASFSSGKMKR